MGGKKKRIIANTGSLITPIFRYMVSADFKVNISDQKGANLAEQLHRVAIKTPAQYKQPNFVESWNFITDKPYSYLEAKYINGWEETYQLDKANFNEIKYVIQRNNKVLEGVRNYQGYDDEIEDDARQLQ